MKSRKTDKPRWFIALIIIISLILSINLVLSSWNLKERQSIVEKAENDLNKLARERTMLESELSYVRSNEFIEKEARDKLGLSREGETVIVIGQDQATISGVSTESSGSEGKSTHPRTWWDAIKTIFRK
jgi:cell division protein FtsB